jgi:hypothetical protein
MGAAARPVRAPAAARTLPLTVPPVRPPALPRDVVYGLAHVDRSGRVAAVPAEDILTAYSLAVVDQALAARIRFPAREGGDR